MKQAKKLESKEITPIQYMKNVGRFVLHLDPKLAALVEEAALEDHENQLDQQRSPVEHHDHEQLSPPVDQEEVQQRHQQVSPIHEEPQQNQPNDSHNLLIIKKNIIIDIGVVNRMILLYLLLVIEKNIIVDISVFNRMILIYFLLIKKNIIEIIVDISAFKVIPLQKVKISIISPRMPLMTQSDKKNIFQMKVIMNNLNHIKDLLHCNKVKVVIQMNF